MMNRFDWKKKLDEAYAAFPEAERKPVIGITGNYGEQACMLADRYYKSVVAAGGIPVIVPPVADTGTIINTLAHLDALLLSGGGDYNPLYAGEEPSPHLKAINNERDLPELLITRLAYNRQLPMLGICRGMQTLAMALGGKVAQDLSALKGRDEGSSVKHSQDAGRNEPTHTVTVGASSILGSVYAPEGGGQCPALYVNSFHHQAVSEPGKRFRATAWSADGVIEAIESTEYKSVMGVQWHPECLEEGLPLFRWLVRQAAHFRQAIELHDRVLTFDSHCDTPMFFPQGISFDRRDPRIRVDLHKMEEGRQDAVVMVAYLPQPKLGEKFSSLVDVSRLLPTAEMPAGRSQGTTPFDYANLVFDRIEDIVRQNRDYISIARTPADLYEDKRHHRKSIMLGIENGLALNGNLQNVKHFAQRGIVYITLCHNGDNDVCDSARGCNTHNGVSRFGEKVIGEMNRLGIMVDLSHGSEKSFYDALEISRMPIVCSHSSCRALCDHPRNLTDDQLRAIARKGGVVQITLYHGFLRTAGEATVTDAVAHLEHAIKVAGIDHVGIGTDFDGDGGIRGFEDSSEVINFTRQLLARQYSGHDIQKIWGGNFLRVMACVQKLQSPLQSL